MGPDVASGIWAQTLLVKFGAGQGKAQSKLNAIGPLGSSSTKPLAQKLIGMQKALCTNLDLNKNFNSMDAT